MRRACGSAAAYSVEQRRVATSAKSVVLAGRIPAFLYFWIEPVVIGGG